MLVNENNTGVHGSLFTLEGYDIAVGKSWKKRIKKVAKKAAPKQIRKTAAKFVPKQIKSAVKKVVPKQIQSAVKKATKIMDRVAMPIQSMKDLKKAANVTKGLLKNPMIQQMIVTGAMSAMGVPPPMSTTLAGCVTSLINKPKPETVAELLESGELLPEDAALAMEMVQQTQGVVNDNIVAIKTKAATMDDLSQTFADDAYQPVMEIPAQTAPATFSKSFNLADIAVNVNLVI